MRETAAVITAPLLERPLSMPCTDVTGGEPSAPSPLRASAEVANILHDRDDYQAAFILFRDAATLDPEFADAHFNLALTCEQLRRVEEALRYWRRYLALDPAGDWAAIAREHLAGSVP